MKRSDWIKDEADYYQLSAAGEGEIDNFKERMEALRDEGAQPLSGFRSSCYRKFPHVERSDVEYISFLQGKEVHCKEGVWEVEEL